MPNFGADCQSQRTVTGDTCKLPPSNKRKLNSSSLSSILESCFAKEETSDDGRDQWPSRTSFILASMGGCAGMGNLLRFPSQVYNNNGIQWFIPYLMAIFIIAIPVLILEIAIGQAYRGGSVIAYNNINRRLKGVGLSLLYTAFVVGPYFVTNLAWIMIYFRNSFKSPLPWTGRGQEFYMDDVVANFREGGSSYRLGLCSVSRHCSHWGDCRLVSFYLVSCLAVHLQRCRLDRPSCLLHHVATYHYDNNPDWPLCITSQCR